MPNSGRCLNACLSAGWHVHPQAGERSGGRGHRRVSTVVCNEGTPGAGYAVVNHHGVTIAVIAQMKPFCAVNSVPSAGRELAARRMLWQGSGGPPARVSVSA